MTIQTGQQILAADVLKIMNILFGKEGSALTIASGVITVTGNESFFKVSGQSAAADDLVTINGGTDGDIIILAYDGEAITLKETDNIDTGDWGDLLILAAAGNSVILRHDGSNWVVQTTNVNMGIGEETVYIPASAMISEAGVEPGALEKLDFGSICHYGIPFDDTVNEFVGFNLGMPKRFDGGSCYAKFYWATKAGASGNVVLCLGGYKLDTGDALGNNPSSVTYGQIIDAWVSNTDIHISGWTGAVTLTGSVSDDNPFLEMQMFRYATSGSDTFSGDIYLLGVLFRWTSDQETDD